MNAFNYTCIVLWSPAKGKSGDFQVFRLFLLVSLVDNEAVCVHFASFFGVLQKQVASISLQPLLQLRQSRSPQDCVVLLMNQCMHWCYMFCAPWQAEGIEATSIQRDACHADSTGTWHCPCCLDQHNQSSVHLRALQPFAVGGWCQLLAGS